MDDLRLVFSDVLARPEEDAPRAAFADAVEAQDPAWAEVIRLELRTTQARRAGQDYAPELSTRAQTLKMQHAHRWAGRIDQFVSGWSLMRGFVEVVSVDAEWFLETSDDLYGMAPILHLDLTDAQLCAEDLFSSPALRRIHSIRLYENDFGDEEARLLANSPYLGNLEWLHLGHNHIGRDGLEALAASPHLPRLGYLNFERNTVEDPTPRWVDEYGATTGTARELMDRYGHRRWLDASIYRDPWPPSRDVVP